MIDARYALWAFVMLFGLIGAMRPARKEFLVTISIVLALYAVNILLNKNGQLVNFVPEVTGAAATPLGREGVRLQRLALLGGVFLFIVFLGYLGPAIAPSGFAGKGSEIRLARAQAGLLGFFLGVVNGFAIVSTVATYARVKGVEVLADANFPATAQAYTSPPTGGWDSLAFLRYAPAAVIPDGVLVVMLVVAFLVVIYAYV
jgi:hypothetical protein